MIAGAELLGVVSVHNHRDMDLEIEVLSEALKGSDLRIQLQIHFFLTCIMEGRPGTEGRPSDV